MGPYIFRWYINYNDVRNKTSFAVYRFSGWFENFLVSSHIMCLKSTFVREWNMELNVLWSGTIIYVVCVCVRFNRYVIEDDFPYSCKSRRTWVEVELWSKFQWNVIKLKYVRSSDWNKVLKIIIRPRECDDMKKQMVFFLNPFDWQHECLDIIDCVLLVYQIRITRCRSTTTRSNLFLFSIQLGLKSTTHPFEDAAVNNIYMDLLTKVWWL